MALRGRSGPRSPEGLCFSELQARSQLRGPASRGHAPRPAAEERKQGPRREPEAAAWVEAVRKRRRAEKAPCGGVVDELDVEAASIRPAGLRVRLGRDGAARASVAWEETPDAEFIRLVRSKGHFE